MGRARNPARDKAYDMWVASGCKAKIKDIAATLGVPDSQVRKWKSEDKWDKKKKEQSQKERSDKPLRKKGAQPGNKNAVGNSGGAAPMGNQNAMKHGGYARLLNEDVFSDDELEYFDSDEDVDAELELVELIRTYRIRERRLLKAINKYAKENEAILTAQSRSETKRRFKDKEEEALYKQKIAEKVRKDERLPGESYNIQVITEPRYKRIERLEMELTKVQRAKKEAIAALAQIRADKIGSTKNAIADDFLASFDEDGDEDAES